VPSGPPQCGPRQCQASQPSRPSPALSSSLSDQGDSPPYTRTLRTVHL
jgi:hypothetical protein